MTVPMWSPVVGGKKGYAKINYTCEQARPDGLGYVWIDSCCINKESSSELSEVINSMYRWYYTAAVCYPYLSDAPAGHFSRYVQNGGCNSCINAVEGDLSWRYLDHSQHLDRPEDEGYDKRTLVAIQTCRWFERGWTLQELIAPTQSWGYLGSKTTLANILAQITAVDREALLDRDSVTSMPLAKSLSWAARRKTT